MGTFTIKSYKTDTTSILRTQHDLKDFSYQLSKVRNHTRQWQFVRDVDNVVLAQSSSYLVRDYDNAELTLTYRAGKYSWFYTQSFPLFWDEIFEQLAACRGNVFPYNQWRITRKIDGVIVASSELTNLLNNRSSK